MTITDTRTVRGERFYYRTFDIDSEDYTFNVVLSQGDNQHQSEDVTGISKDIYLEITSTTNKYTVKDITDQYAILVGDVNGDGEVSIGDVTALIDILLGTPADADTLIRCEVNGDGEVSIGDITALIDMLLS